MRNYEIMYILKADLDDAAREAAVQDLQKLLEENCAQVKATDLNFGLRDLAYPINDETKVSMSCSKCLPMKLHFINSTVKSELIQPCYVT